MIKNSLLLLLCVLLFSTCKKDENVLFEMDYDLEFTIQPGLNPLGGIYGYKIKDITSNFNSYLTANGLTIADITKISCGSARVTSQLSGSGYGFIRDATVIIASPTDESYFRPAFERFQVPENTGLQLDLIGTLIDATPFLTEPNFEIRFEMSLRQHSPELMHSRLQLKFQAIGE